MSCFESAQAIVFTFLIVFTGMDTSSKLETVIIYTTIPIRIFFDHLKVQMLMFIVSPRVCPLEPSRRPSAQRICVIERTKTNLTIADRIVAFIAAVEAIELTWTI